MEEAKKIATLEEYREYYHYTKPEIHRLRERIADLEDILGRAWTFVPHAAPTYKVIEEALTKLPE